MTLALDDGYQVESHNVVLLSSSALLIREDINGKKTFSFGHWALVPFSSPKFSHFFTIHPNFRQNRRKSWRKFNRKSLPSPASYYVSQCSDEVRSLSGGIPEILMACRIFQIFIA